MRVFSNCTFFDNSKVVKPIDALGGEIAPWFDQLGGGIQYKFNNTIQELLDGGYIRKVEP